MDHSRYWYTYRRSIQFFAGVMFNVDKLQSDVDVWRLTWVTDISTLFGHAIEYEIVYNLTFITYKDIKSLIQSSLALKELPNL